MSEIRKTKTGKPLGDHEVGYGRPPKATQFRQGQSGNPKDRKKKKPSSLSDIVRGQLDEKVSVRVGESTQVHSAREALLMKARTEAFKGGPRDIKIYFELVEKYAPGSLQPPPLTLAGPRRGVSGRPELHFPDPAEAEARLADLLKVDDPDGDAWQEWKGYQSKGEPS